MSKSIGCYECAWGKVAGCWRCGSRAHFTHVRRVVRTFRTMCTMAVDQVNKTDDIDMLKNCARWMTAEYNPLQAQGFDMASISIDHCMGPSLGGYGPSIQGLRNDPELKARFLSHFRMARYFRAPSRLPA